MKKLIVPILIILIILISFIGYMFYSTNKTNDFFNKNGISSSLTQNESSSSTYIASSLTTSSSKSSESISSTQQISFALNKPSIDERNPYTSEISKFNSLISENNNVNIKMINPSSALISFPTYSIMVKGVSEEFPTNRIYSSKDFKVNSSFAKIVYRLDYSNDSDTNNYFKSLKLNYQYYYLYTTELSPNCPTDFPKDKYCGESISLYSEDKKLSAVFTVTCLINDKNNISKCDEFIQNLNVARNAIKLF